MELLTPSWLLVFLGLGLILTELLVGVQTGFDLVLIGVALVVGGAVGQWQGSWQLGLVVTTIVTLLYLVLARKVVRSRVLGTTTKSTNTDSLIGQTGAVVRTIGKGKAGQVRLGHEIWRAQSDRPLAVGTPVRVLSLEGVTIRVVQSS